MPCFWTKKRTAPPPIEVVPTSGAPPTGGRTPRDVEEAAGTAASKRLPIAGGLPEPAAYSWSSVSRSSPQLHPPARSRRGVPARSIRSAAAAGLLIRDGRPSGERVRHSGFRPCILERTGQVIDLSDRGRVLDQKQTPPMCALFCTTVLSFSEPALHRLRIGFRSDLRTRSRGKPMRLEGRQRKKKLQRNGTTLAPNLRHDRPFPSTPIRSCLAACWSHRRPRG
jgi:hypothetical protein